MTIDVGSQKIYVGTSSLDPQELRFALLFWDELLWPKSRIILMESSPDEQFLEQTGVLKRPFEAEGPTSGNWAEQFHESRLRTFRKLEKDEPGKWAMANGVKSYQRVDEPEDAIDVRGGLLTLVRAIPVPNFDVPLAEVLEFKQRRADELLALRREIEHVCIEAENAADSNHAVLAAADRVDKACRDLLDATKSGGIRFRLSDFEAAFKLDLVNSFKVGGAVWAALQSFNMPHVAGLVAGASGVLSNAKIGRRAELGLLRKSTEPYQYVSSFHSELF